ncbi:hypothetical protein H2200_013632 [Cladophialophora chaetospira]|uniref:RING finger domain protein (Znf1) n=1 Tax=Cladophialophora chaetospira TaxID=386627 RepID=A0AA38U4F9_9EURO|nr:hypothetical protein H2200_013632 [Cladophialophora chaetospira]
MPTSISRLSRTGAVTKTAKPKPEPHLKSLQKSSKRTSQVHHFKDSNDLATPTKSKGTRPKKSPSHGHEEKRLRRVRTKPPASFLTKLERAQTQRMIVLGRKRRDVAGAPAEDIDVVGSTGNIYTVTVSHVPSCTCPDSVKGNECKHKVYALHTVLKAPSHLQYQLALLTSELEEIFASAPPLPTDLAEDSKGNRKPTDGECPICYMDLDEEHNKLVWCKAQCGHNLHKSCFDQWAKSQSGTQVRCVYCRTPWETEISDIEAVKKSGEQSEDGYVNVAEQFGISRARDYTGYYQPWARRQFGVGW